MKRIILISYLILNIYSCVQAKRSPQDPTSPTSFLINLLFSNTVNISNNSTTSNSIPSLSYPSSPYSFYVGETVSITAITSNVTSCSSSLTLPTGLSLNTTNCNITGTATAASTSKSYSILATSNKNSTSADITITVDPAYRIFRTNTQTTGNITITLADNFCNSDGGRPNSSTYKAMLVGSTRRACSNYNCFTGSSENLNWVLKASTNYFRADGVTLVGKTNQAGIFSDGNFTILNASISSSSQQVWTGLQTDFTNSSSNCLNWTSNSGAQFATFGITDSISSQAFSQSTTNCSAPLSLLCVEQ